MFARYHACASFVTLNFIYKTMYLQNASFVTLNFIYKTMHLQTGSKIGNGVV